MNFTNEATQKELRNAIQKIKGLIFNNSKKTEMGSIVVYCPCKDCDFYAYEYRDNAELLPRYILQKFNMHFTTLFNKSQINSEHLILCSEIFGKERTLDELQKVKENLYNQQREIFKFETYEKLD